MCVPITTHDKTRRVPPSLPGMWGDPGVPDTDEGLPVRELPGDYAVILFIAVTAGKESICIRAGKEQTDARAVCGECMTEMPICPIMSNNRLQGCIKEKCMAWQVFTCEYEGTDNCEHALCGYQNPGGCTRPDGYCKLIDPEGI